MTKRILFVDDEPRVLRGLERTFYPMSTEWDMEFAESGPKALDLMAQRPFDAVVTDMHMPGMNGAQLLNQVMRRYPKTLRLILSGTADQHLILQCVGSTHQYLAKPCDPEALKAVLLRAATLESSLHNEKLRNLIAQMDRVPTIPVLYGEILAQLQTPDASMEPVGEIIGRDPGMTAKILKLVNSAFFGLARQVASPAEAVAYLGVDTIKSLVLSLHTFSQFESTSLGSLALETLWKHSLSVAAAAKTIARLEGAEANLMDEAFAAGLLHDIGKLVLGGNFAPLYSSAVRLAESQRLSLLSAEQQVFGATHADVGGYLLGLWGLPVPVVEAIALHHRPDKSFNKGFTPLTAVHVANALVQEPRDRPSPIPLPPLDLGYLAQMGRSDCLPVWRQTLRI